MPATRREWTPQDTKYLKTHAKMHTPAWVIAKHLNRTEGATRQKAFSIGLSMDTGTKTQLRQTRRPSGIRTKLNTRGQSNKRGAAMRRGRG
jgi:hypothetical protein